MEIWCGLSADQLDGRQPDVIVFPEGVAAREIETAERHCPDAIVAGAVKIGRRMRGILRHRGRDCVGYWKAESDGRTEGSGVPERWPVYLAGDIAVGLLICMDIQRAELLTDVLGWLRQSAAPVKVLCIPAEMQSGAWFESDLIGYPSWNGIYVALSNNSALYGDTALPSFITDTARTKVRKRQRVEAIFHR